MFHQWIWRPRVAVMILLALLLVPSGLVACGGGAQSQSSTVTLTWFMRTDPHEPQWEKEQISAYEKLHPNIKINLVLSPNNQFDPKINTLLNSDTPPDLFQPLGNTGFADYMHRGLLLNLSPLIQQNGYDWGGTPKAAYDTYTVQGNIYAIPAITLGSYLYYNKDIWDAYNRTHSPKLAYPPVDWSDTSWTWDKMVDIANKLTDSSKHVYGVIDGLYPTIPYSWMSGEQPFSPASGVPKTFTLSSPTVVNTFQQLGDWYTKSHITPPYTEQQAANNQGLDLFMSGKVAMILTGGWGFRNYNTASFHWAAAALPTIKTNTDATFTDSYVISKTTQHPKETFDFIKFLTGKSAMESYVNEVAFTPANQDYLDTWYSHVSSTTGMSTQDLKTLVSGAVAHGQPSPDHVIVHFGEMYSKMTQDLQPLWLGTTTATQQLPVVQQDIQQVITQIS